MIKLYPTKGVTRVCVALLFIIISIIVFSCRKELKLVPLSATDSVDAARSWYEKSFPVNNALGVANNLTTLAVNGNKNGVPFDYSQYVKPDWNHNARYRRFDKDVIEMPVDPSHFLNLGMKNANTGQLISAKENSRAWFLLLNDGKTYDAYIMVLIGDPSYIDGDPSRLAKNSYRKRDANFSGMLFYFTPKGKFIRSYQYKNGHQVNSSSTLSGSSPSTQTQSVNKKTNQLQGECTPWYMDYYIDGIFQYEIYVYTTCEVYDDGTDTNPYGGASTPPCQAGYAVTQRAINHVAPGDGDGDGDGNDPTNPVQGYPVPGQTCSAPDVRIIDDSLKKHFPCAALLIVEPMQNIPSYASYTAPFASPQKPNLTWTDGTLPWNDNGDGTYAYGLTDATLGGINRSVTITLNKQMLQNSSQLLIAANVIHESLHAYINYMISTADYNISQGISPNGSWLSSMDSWITLFGLPTGYSNHYEMLDAYFDKSVSILASLYGNQYTADQYKMAMLIGLDNGQDGDAAQQARLQSLYTAKLQSLGITDDDLDKFKRANTNSANNKLPNNCN